MKIFKRIGCILMMALVTINPIINLYATTTNEEQITYKGGSKTQDGVTISKEISSSTIENYFDITLKVKTKELAKEQDIAVVIVMDVSNTMMEYTSDNKTTKLRAAMNAGEELIKEIQKYSNQSNASLQIGYVAFNSNARKIFDIQEVKTQTEANNLVKTMQDKTKAIVTNIDEKTKEYDGNQNEKYTNIEAGIKLADDMLYSSSSKNIQNKFVILLSDGFPTTYIKSGYTGYSNRTPNATKANHSTDGMFYDEVNGAPVAIGADYSDKGALRAEQAATKLKNKGTIIYSIGTGLTNDAKTVDYYGNLYKGKHYFENGKDMGEFSTVDRTSTNYVIGKTVSDFKKWLGGTGNSSNPGIGSGYSNHYFDVTNTSELVNAYKKIFEDMKEVSEASWVSEDPMNTSSNEALKNIIGFVGIYDSKNKLNDSVTKGSNSDNTASYNKTTDSITWDLKNSNYKTTKETANGVTTTYYEYELKYRVRLINENTSFKENTSYKTNGVTTLTYVYKPSGSIPVTKTMEFDIPKVKGYLSTLTFTKKSSFNSMNLSGIEFELVHSSDCECLSEKSHMSESYKLTSISDDSGKVIFNNVPSGHKYILKETKTNSYHILDENEYKVSIDYGKLTSDIKNNTIINTHKTNSLTIEKLVDGVETNKEFTFKITAKYNTNNLTGEYSGLLNNKETKITFTDGVAEVKLKNKDKLIINDLPYSMKYTISEMNSDGFIVKYKIDKQDVVFSTSTKESSLVSDTLVTFTNISGYELPDTGSSSTLIMIIIGSLLLVIPVIYIGKNTLKKADN